MVCWTCVCKTGIWALVVAASVWRGDVELAYQAALEAAAGQLGTVVLGLEVGLGDHDLAAR